MGSIFGESGFCPSTGIYRSPWDSPSPPPAVSLPEFLLSHCFLPSRSATPAFIDAVSGAALSYSALRAVVAAASHALTALGLRRGDVALLVSPNSLHVPALALAVMSLGAVISTANFLNMPSEIKTQIQNSNAKLLITTEELAASKLHGLGPQLVLIEPFFANLQLNFSSPPPPPGPTHPSSAASEIGPSDPAAVMYSSGTTGKSKGVVGTHGNLVAMASLLRHVWGTGREVYACVVPLFHMFGFSVMVCGALASGATVVVLPRYSLEELLMAVEEHRVTRLPAAPPVIVQMAKSPEVARGYDLGSLKEVICSGAPISREHLERFADAYPGITLSQCYGLTETSGPITLCDGLKGRFQVSIGRLIPTMEAKIVEVRTGKALPPNKLGQLYVRGAPVMRGYLKNQEATSLAIDEEGWLRTGDLCYIDSRGLVYVVDRIKELIKYKAYQVAPAELEEVLSTHPDILDVAVIPHPDEEAGEIPMACVVRKAGSRIKEEDIISFMENKVAPYRKVRKVTFVEFIPRSPSGKILRRQLKAGTAAQSQKLEISARL